MIKLFGFSSWDSYGEAEAECAFLQRLGFVDAVYTGDSDVFLFGARRVIRQWPSKRHEPVPVYDLTWIYDSTNLDRSDLILIALLHGSDYDTKGTKGIGINVAAQLAKCHFHRQLFDDIQLAGRIPLDDERVQHLFDDLSYELQHNSTRNMKKKYAGVVLDPKFPDFSIVIDFIHPLTNIQSNDHAILQKAKALELNLNMHREPDWQSLANFAQNTFKWPGDYVLKRFTSLLFPAFMANRMRRRAAVRLPNSHQRASSAQDNGSSSQQTSLIDYFRPTARSQAVEKPADVVQIFASKVVPEGNLKLYRVEWDRSCWEHFVQLLTPRLDFSVYHSPEDTAVLSQRTDGDLYCDENDQEVAAAGTKQGAYKKDMFDLVRRQWVDADDIHHKYPSLALEFQARKRKTAANADGQTKLTSFLILPRKRIRTSCNSNIASR
ncbi:hypothetical protein BD408DRAFT_414422 [Parasitella parasitica]|nr:hypothetical protein BD408DRAFT_414422 [Parasitella parasitica]